MKTKLLWVGLALGLWGCTTETGAVEQEVGTVTCGADLRPFDFGRFPSGHTAEEVARLARSSPVGDGGTDALANVMQVESISCGTGLTLKTTDLEVVRGLCDGKQSCFPVHELNKLRSCQSTRVPEWASQPMVNYRCSAEDGTLRHDFPSDARCPLRQAWSQSTVCVPENCYGRTSRDVNMQCVPDLLKPVESALSTMLVRFDSVARTLLVPGQPEGQAIDTRGRLVLDQEQLYRFKGKVLTTGDAPRQLLTLWVASKLPEPGGAAPRIDAVRCVIGKLDLAKYTAVNDGPRKVITFDEVYRVPATCSAGEPFQKAVRTAWRAQNFDVSAPTLEVPTDTNANTLMASYDLEGNALVLPTPDSPLTTSCSTKPVDFFFNYQAGVHDAYGYYAQNRVASSAQDSAFERVVFNQAAKTLIRPSEVIVRGLEFRVNKQGRVRGDIPLDLSMQLSGPESAHWQRVLRWYAPERTTRYNAEGKRTGGVDWSRVYFQFSPFVQGSATSTALIPVPDPAALDANGNPIVDTGAMIPLPGPMLQPSLESATETGTARSLTLPLTNSLRTALFNPRGRYPLLPGGRRTYVVQFCTEATPTFYSVRTNWNYRWNASRTDLVRVDDPSSVEQVTIPLGSDRWLPSLPLESAVNNCARSGLFSFYGEDIVLPVAEPETGDGDNGDSDETTSGESRMSADFDPSFDRQCDGVVGSERCSTTVTQELSGKGGPLGQTVFSLESEADEEGAEEDMTETLKILGFSVLKLPDQGAFEETENTIAFAPKLEPLAKRAKEMGAPIPFFHAEAKSFSASIKGLALGLEYGFPLRFGPVQGDLTFSLSAGVGLGFELSHEYNGNVGTSCATLGADGGVSDQPCSDATTLLPAMPLRTARETCVQLGGRLAEPRTDAALAVVRQFADAGTELWVGAQTGNEYRANTDCLSSWNTAACAAGHTTYLRWFSDGSNFLKSQSFGPFLSSAAPSTLNGMVVTGAVLAAQKPEPSGVTLRDTQFASRPLTNAYPAVCVRPRITSGSSHELKLAMKLGFAAGFGVEFCTPSADSPFALCLGGSVNVLEATLSPNIAFTFTQARDNTGKTAMNSSMSRKLSWELKILTGAIEVKVVTPFGDFSYTLVGFDGHTVGEGDLVSDERIFQKEIQ